MNQHMPNMVAVMTPFPYSIKETATIADAEKMMEEHNIHHLPVMVDGNIDSIVSQRDLQRARLVGHRTQPEEELQVGDISPTRAFFADANDPLDKILDVMADKHLGAALILREGEMVGIFTTYDACRKFSAQLRSTFPPEPEDSVA
ncbi:MAG: CBS domain-containing protein [Pseudomonadales bacterium]